MTAIDPDSNNLASVASDEEIADLHRRTVLRDIWKNIFLLLCGLAAASSVILTIFLEVQTLDIAHSNKALNKQATENTQRLVDCTTPGGKCYEQGRNATSGAVGTINKVTIIAIACSRIPANDTISEIQACVQANIK